METVCFSETLVSTYDTASIPRTTTSSSSLPPWRPENLAKKRQFFLENSVKFHLSLNGTITLSVCLENKVDYVVCDCDKFCRAPSAVCKFDFPLTIPYRNINVVRGSSLCSATGWASRLMAHDGAVLMYKLYYIPDSNLVSAVHSNRKWFLFSICNTSLLAWFPKRRYKSWMNPGKFSP
jgi:hypothetical protein